MCSLGNPLEDPDAQCQNVTAKDPVAKECCGFCILNNAHLMKMWNCTGLRDLIGNTLGINALARSSCPFVSLTCSFSLHAIFPISIYH